MRRLSRALANIFAPAKKRNPANPSYRRFRRLAAKHNLSYDICDGYIDIKSCAVFPRGLSTAHYDWDETLARIEHCIAHPESVDNSGSYSE